SVSATQAPSSLPARCKHHWVPSSWTVILNISFSWDPPSEAHARRQVSQLCKSFERQRLSAQLAVQSLAAGARFLADAASRAARDRLFCRERCANRRKY